MGYLTPYPARRGTIELPDGVLYPTTATTVEPGTWYAVAHFFRFVVTGHGTVSIDGKDLFGNLTGNLASCQSLDLDVLWYPDMAASTSFRINVISGTPVVKYLP